MELVKATMWGAGNVVAAARTGEGTDSAEVRTGMATAPGCAGLAGLGSVGAGECRCWGWQLRRLKALCRTPNLAQTHPDPPCPGPTTLCALLQLCLELLITLALRNRDRVGLIWPLVHEFLAAVTSPDTAERANPLVERAVIGLLRVGWLAGMKRWAVCGGVCSAAYPVGEPPPVCALLCRMR